MRIPKLLQPRDGEDMTAYKARLDAKFERFERGMMDGTLLICALMLLFGFAYRIADSIQVTP